MLSHANGSLPVILCVVVCCAAANHRDATAGTLAVSFSKIETDAVIDLTAEGVLDWVHWGLETDSSINRKANVPPQISDFSVLYFTNGYASAFRYADNYSGYTWYDGTPRQAVTNTPTGAWVYGTPQHKSGFQFTAPASTNEQWLKVYVGAYAAIGSMIISLSDESARAYRSEGSEIVTNISNGPGAVYSIRYSADSPDQKLIVSYTLAETLGPDAGAGNVTLQAATLGAPDANNPPIPVLVAPVNNTATEAFSEVILAASAFDLDGTVSSLEFFAGTNKIAESAGPVIFTTWNPPAGHYVVTARATDDRGAIGISQPVDVFVHADGGSLSGGWLPPPNEVDLSTEGTADWAHWGLNSPADFNHKVDGGGQIPNLARIGTQPVERSLGTRTGFSWTGGTPVPGVISTNTGVYITGLTNGFEFSAPAGTTRRMLRVYTGLYGVRGNFQAWLSDFSAPAYTDTSISNVFGTSSGLYTLNYRAAGEGVRIFIRYTVLEPFDFDYGNVSIMAATLQEMLPPGLLLRDVTASSTTFSFSFLTEPGRSYTGQYATTAGDTNWQSFTNILGNGELAWIIEDRSSTQRIYRVKIE